MGRSDAECVEWARAHRLAYEITPLIEMRGGERMQVGFNFSLYAEVAEEDAEDTAAGEALKQEMEAFVQDALAIEARVAQVEPDPERIVVTRPENQLKPELCLAWRIVHKEEYLTPVTSQDRERLAQLEQRLRQLGVKWSHW